MGARPFNAQFFNLKTSNMSKTEIYLYESPQKEANEEKYGLLSNQCICCGKPMNDNEPNMVHMNTNWMAMHNSIVTELDCIIHGYQSQGYFPIGNNCSKKMPKQYIHKAQNK